MRALAPGEEASGATDEPRRFDPGLLFDVLPDGSVAYSDSAGYSIKLVAGDGAPIGTIARPIGPEPGDHRARDDRPGLGDAFGPDGLAARVELDELDVPRVVVGRVGAGVG